MTHCQQKSEPVNEREVIQAYIDATNQGDFNVLRQYITDSINMSEADYQLSTNLDEFYRLFQWDSVFSPQYEILASEKVDGAWQITLSKQGQRVAFLHDTPISYQSVFTVQDGKITRIRTDKYLEFDDNRWRSRRDTLVVWIERNHPELNGFVHNQSLQGALDYLEAIELYEANQN